MPDSRNTQSTSLAPVLVVGLDAMESSLIREWASCGQLPHIGALMEEGFGLEMDNRVPLFPDTIWFEITTGRSWQRTGCYYAPAQLHPGETWMRPLNDDILEGLPFFWKSADRAGRRVLVVDHPHAPLVPGFAGVHIQGFSLHHPDWTRSSLPEGEYRKQRLRLGPDRVRGLETGSSSSVSDHLRLHRALIRSVGQKEDLVSHYLRGGSPHLTFVTFTEAHTAGHAFWHLHDQGHPLHPEGGCPKTAHLLRSVYTRIDTAIGRLLKRLPPDCRVLLVASHGMKPLSGGWEILPELLLRLGLSPRRAIRHGLSRKISPGVKRSLRRFVPQRLKRRYHLGLNAMVWSFDDAAIQAVAVPNGCIGAIRLNLAGRDPRGALQPGSEADSVMDRIETALHELRCVKTGRPVVSNVLRTRREFGAGIPSQFPDMVIHFRDEIIPLQACRSERVGVLKRLPSSIRTGDHTDHSYLVGKGFSVNRDRGDVLDVAPSVLELLGVSPPDASDGRSLVAS